MAMSSFKAAWWLQNPHAQSIWATLFKHPKKINELWDRIELPDGDFIDLVWNQKNAHQIGAPIVLLLHGLGGGIKSPYIQGCMRVISENGWRPLLMHFRGASGLPNRLPRGYHSGETTDLAHIVNRINQLEPTTPLATIGFSLGGNVLLKWLGETGTKNPLVTAVAVSVPFVLSKCADRFEMGFSGVYQWWLLRQLKKETKVKFRKIPGPLDLNQIDSLRSFWEYDDVVTARLHGFKDVHDYYQQSSSRQYLPKISTPTLIIQAKDDPFILPEALPYESELSASTNYELSNKGGHVGFIEGNVPGYPHYWLEERIPAHLSQYF